MMEAYVVEKVANALNKRFVAAGVDRVVRPQNTHAVHTVGEKIDSLRSAGSVLLGVPREPQSNHSGQQDCLESFKNLLLKFLI